MKKILCTLMSIMMILAVATGCGQTGGDASSAQTGETGTKVITNCDGTEVTVPEKVDKIGCLFGPSYEKVVLLGAEDKIVFDGDYHINSWPWSNVIYKHLNDVPGITNAHSAPNIEDLMGYEPDLVFNFPNPETTKAMEEAGMYVVPMASTDKYDSIVDELEVYAEAIGGDAPKIAEKYSSYFYEVADKVKEGVKNIPEAERKTVYFANENILKTHGNKSSILDLIELCGGVPVTSEIDGGNSMEVTAEQLVAWDPDYIFVDHAGSSGNKTAEQVIDEMVAQDVYSEMKAVKNDHVEVVPTGVFFWDSGVQKPLLMLYLASTLYPEAFSDVDMKAETKAFYSEFFDYDLSDDEVTRILAHLDPETK